MARVVGRARPAACQQRQPRAGPVCRRQQGTHLGQAQAAHARRGQLDGQRQAMQRAHDVDHQALVAGTQVEVGSRGAGAIQEEGQRGVERLRRQVVVDFGQGQRRQHLLDLAVEPEHAARGHEQVQLRQVRQPARHVVAAGFDELLEVVQHQQHAPAGQAAGHALCGVGTLAAAVLVQRVQQGVEHLGAVAARGQRHEGDEVEGRSRITRPASGAAAAHRPLRPGACHLHRQPRLAGAARSAQHHQTLLGQGRCQRVAHGVEADQARQVARQPGVGHCGRRGRGKGSRHPGGQGFGPGGVVRTGLQHPFVEMPRQQLTLAAARRHLGLAARQRLVEGVHVAGHRAGDEADGAPIGYQHGVGRRASGRSLEQAAQHRQRLAQPVAAGLTIRTGPQQVDQLFARMLPLRRHRQAGQQQRDGPRGQARRPACAVQQLDSAQQAQPPARGLRRGGGRRVSSTRVGHDGHAPASGARAAAAAPSSPATGPGPARAAGCPAPRSAPDARRTRSTPPRSQSPGCW